MTVKTRIYLRRDTAANWVSAQTSAGSTPILGAGELGFETDTGKFKIGNGTTLWGALPYGPVGLTYSSGTNAVVDRATNLASAGVGLPYQSAANTTSIVTTSAGDNGKSVVISGGVPALSLLTTTTTYFTPTTSANFATILTDATGAAGGVAVFSNSPTLTTPTISSGGITFTGSSSGTTVLKAKAVAGTTSLFLPAETGNTLLTAETAASTYPTTTSVSTNYLSKTSNTAQTLAGTVSGVSISSSSNGFRNITVSTSAPTGGSDGDIWFVYV